VLVVATLYFTRPILRPIVSATVTFLLSPTISSLIAAVCRAWCRPGHAANLFAPRLMARRSSLINDIATI